VFEIGDAINSGMEENTADKFAAIAARFIENIRKSGRIQLTVNFNIYFINYYIF
jgi:hypothetical protein